MRRRERWMILLVTTWSLTETRTWISSRMPRVSISAIDLPPSLPSMASVSRLYLRARLGFFFLWAKESTRTHVRGTRWDVINDHFARPCGYPDCSRMVKKKKKFKVGFYKEKKKTFIKMVYEKGPNRSLLAEKPSYHILGQFRIGKIILVRWSEVK